MNQAFLSQSLPARLCAAFAFLTVLAGPAQAHADRFLPVRPDGSVPDVPAQFGPVNLIMTGLGSKNPFIRLKIGPHQTTLPACVARLIRSENLTQVQVAGSWYHLLREGGLPYYMSMTFFEPGYDRKRSFNSNLHFLFNLNDATLISARSFEADQSGNGGHFGRLVLPPECKLNEAIESR
jgi:hypothetical protein